MTANLRALRLAVELVTADVTTSTIDPQSNRVGMLHLGFRPAAVAVEQRAVWVALAA